ncbi:MAG: hypothetical protein JNL11_12480 [Bdellovibrionaceae bacterium]|nr:hypothetical protein [Pseudobdellovibrionaceae bacterium]
MKMNFKSLIVTIFIIQTTLSPFVLAQQLPQSKGQEGAPPSSQATEQASSEAQQFATFVNSGDFREAGSLLQSSEKPYSLLLATACQGQAEYLSGFINKVEQTNGNGQVIEGVTVKGSLTEKENVYGERNFDYDKIQDAIFNTEGTPESKRCLHFFNVAALSEYNKYFDSRSKDNECGLSLDFSERTPKLTRDPSKKTAKCDVDYGGKPLYQFLEEQMQRFADVVEKLNKKNDDARTKAQAEVAPREKTEAAIGQCSGNDCSPHKGLDYPDTVKVINKECCDVFRDNWEVLGFSTVKGAKPTNRICNDMFDKDNDEGYCEGRFCSKTLGECLVNFFGAFAKNAYSSFIDSFDVVGWISQLAVLAKEIKSGDLYETAAKIVKGMFGFDEKHMRCLNRKSQSQYYCQMFGKFSGSSAGFAAGMGGMIGGIKGMAGGIKTFAKTKSLKNVSFIKEPIKQAVKTGYKSAVVATVWPYFMGRGMMSATVKATKTAWTYPPYYFSKVTGGKGVRSVVADSASRVASAVESIRPGAAGGRSAGTTAGSGAVGASGAGSTASGGAASGASASSAAPAATSSSGSGAVGASGAGSTASGGAASGASASSAAPAAMSPTEEILRASRIVEKPGPIYTGSAGKLLSKTEQNLNAAKAKLEQLKQHQNSLSEGVLVGPNGKLNFKNDAQKYAEFNTVTKQVKEVEGFIQTLSKQADDLKKEIQAKKVNNRIGTGVGIGASMNALPAPEENKKDPTKQKDDGRTLAPATQGVGTGLPPKSTPNPAGGSSAPATAPAPEPAPAAAGETSDSASPSGVQRSGDANEDPGP